MVVQNNKGDTICTTYYSGTIKYSGTDNETKMNKDKHIPSGYKPSPLGIIPEDWEVKRLGEIARIGSGGTPSKANQEYWGGNIPWITTALLNNPYIDAVDEFITEQGLKNSSAQLLNSGVLLMAMYGQGQTRGKVSKLLINASTNQACAFIDIHTGNTDYVHQYLIADYDNIRNKSNDGNQKNLSLGIINNIQITFPPIAEQQRIVSVLSLWDTAIAKQTALIEQLTMRKRGLMQQLLTGKKRLKGFEGEWKEVRLGDIGDTYSGLINKNKDDFEEGNAHYIPYMNVFSNEKVDTNNLGQVKVSVSENQTKVKHGDIFFTVSSETPEEVGMASVLLYDIENTYLNSFCFGYRLNGFETLLPVFASYLLRGNSFRKEMYKIAQGSTRFNISKNEVMDMRIALPSIDEQNAIASVLVNADKEIEIQKQKLAAMQEQKKGLMQVLLTGKRRIRK